MPIALERIRTELGPDAVVLESHVVRPGFLWIKPLVEVVASDEAGARGKGSGLRGQGPGAGTVPLPPNPGVRGTHGPLTQPERLGEGSSHLTHQPEVLNEAPSPHSASIAMGDGARSWTNIVDHLSAAADASPLRPLWSVLQRQAVDEQLALEVVLAAATEGDPASWSSRAVAHEALAGQIERRVRTTGPIALEDDRPTILAIVGPTGVGKTTTVAKLATCAKTEGFRVALVTFDTYRAGAVEQLKTYADILDVPIHVAYTPEELQQIIRSLVEVDVILIDTPGCGGNNHPLLEDLQRCFTPMKDCEVHLAISCGTQLPDMLETTRAFGGLGLTGLILTKVDEASCLGPALSLVHQSGKPLSYLTTGQDIPTDVEVATSRRFAELLITGIGGPSPRTPRGIGGPSPRTPREGAAA